MTESDISELARMHRENLTTTSSAIGHSYLTTLYTTLLKQPEIQIGLVAKEKGKILGAITATSDIRITQTNLAKALIPGKIPAILKAVLGRKVNPWDFVKRMQFESKLVSDFPQPYATVLTLFVDPEFRRKGVGKKLMASIISEMKRRKVSVLYVDTRATNTAARRFYTSVGFKELRHIGEDVILARYFP